MEDAVLKRGTGQAPVQSGGSDGLELLREGGGPALEPAVSYAPLAYVVQTYREAGAEVFNIPRQPLEPRDAPIAEPD